MTTHINHNTKSITFTVPHPGKGAPSLVFMRVGQGKVVNFQFKGKQGDKFTFGLSPDSLKPGRYYALVNFGQCCCLKTEVMVDNTCNLLNTTTLSVAAGCSIC
jgi:hypothetical protein